MGNGPCSPSSCCCSGATRGASRKAAKNPSKNPRRNKEETRCVTGEKAAEMRYRLLAVASRVASRTRSPLRVASHTRRLASGLEPEGRRWGIDPGQERGREAKPGPFPIRAGRNERRLGPDQIWKRATSFRPEQRPFRAVPGLTERGLINFGMSHLNRADLREKGTRVHKRERSWAGGQ